MKILFLLLALLFMTGCETFSRNSEIAWQTMHLIDAAQTVQIAKNPHCHSEGNNLTRMFIGEHPSESDVYKWWAGSAILHYFLFKWTDEHLQYKDFDVALRLYDNAHKFGTIARNHGNGLRVDGLSDADQRYCDEQQEIIDRRNSISIPLMRF